MKFPKVSLGRLFHTSKPAEPGAGENATTTPTPSGQKSQGTGFSLSGLKSQRSNSSASPQASTSGSSMPPRSALRNKNPQALKENSLVRLMDNDMSTEFTRQFIHAEEVKQPKQSIQKKVGFAENAEFKNADGETHLEKDNKNGSRHKLATPPMLPGYEERSIEKHNAEIATAATNLSKLVQKHPDKFNAKIQQGIVPKNVIRTDSFGRPKLDKSEHLDILQSFHMQQTETHAKDIHNAAGQLVNLDLGSSEEARKLLQSIAENPPPPPTKPHEDMIIEAPSAQLQLQRAMANIPRSMHEEVLVAYEQLLEGTKVK